MNVGDMLANDLLDRDGCENVIGISIVGILIHMFYTCLNEQTLTFGV